MRERPKEKASLVEKARKACKINKENQPSHSNSNPMHDSPPISAGNREKNLAHELDSATNGMINPNTNATVQLRMCVFGEEEMQASFARWIDALCKR